MTPDSGLLLPSLLAIAIATVACAQVVNGGFEQDPFGAPGISGWEGDAVILGSPAGSPLIPPFDTPPPPIGVQGNCSAGLGSRQAIRQTVIAEGSLVLTLKVWAKSMSGMPNQGVLDLKVLDEGRTVASMATTLQVGGAGADGFTLVSLQISPSAATRRYLSIEIMNQRTLTSMVAVDQIVLEAFTPSAEPRLLAPEPLPGAMRLGWMEPSFGYVLETAADVSDTWSPVPIDQLRRQGERLYLDVPVPANSPMGFFRLRRLGVPL